MADRHDGGDIAIRIQSKHEPSERHCACLSENMRLGLLGGVFLTAAALIQAQPYPLISAVVGAVDNLDAAEFGLARGSLFTIYGTSLALSVASAPGLPLPTVLSGATVTVVSGTLGTPYSCMTLVCIDAPLLYVSPGQINAILPSALPEGYGWLVVKLNGVWSGQAPILVMKSRFGAFTRSQLGFGPAVVQQFDRSGVWLNGLTHPAAPGQAVVLWGTGLGPLPSGQDAEAPGVVDLSSDVVISVGGTLVKPFYAGRSPQLPGLDQINFYLPATVPVGCYVPVTVSVSGTAQFGIFAPPGVEEVGEIRGVGRYDSPPTLSIGTPNSPCASELGLSPALVQRLDQGGTVRIAALSFDSASGAQSAGVSNGDVTQFARARLSDYDVANLSLLATGWRWPPSAPGFCQRQAYAGPFTPQFSAAITLIRQNSSGAPTSDATLKLAITGTNGCSWSPVSGTGGVYAESPLVSCPVSSYSVSGSAGNAPLFSVSGTLPVPRQWSSSDQLQVTGQTAGWSLAGLTPQDRLTLRLKSSKFTGANPALPNGYAENSLTCGVDPGGSSFLVQPDDLQWLVLIGPPEATIEAAQLSVATLLGSSAGIPSPAPPGAPDVFLLLTSNRVRTLWCSSRSWCSYNFF